MESFSEFNTNLIILESELKSNRDKKQPFIILGDWNADVQRGKRFDLSFKNFITRNDLILSDNVTNSDCSFTYRNGTYNAWLDHAVWCSKNSKFINSECLVLNEIDNPSDHLPICLKFKVNSSHANPNFIKIYNQNLEIEIRSSSLLDIINKEPTQNQIEDSYSLL
ncbi:hypothetical protein BpHYR1_046129, partial [Brachionus plicatilis]